MSKETRVAAPSALRTEQVVAAVRALFRRYGFRRTSVDDIAREAGISKATLYLHFKGKEDMFRAMTDQFRAVIIARCRAAETSDAPLQEKLSALLYARYGTALEWFEDAAHIHELTKLNREELAVSFDSDIAAFQHRVERLIAVAVQADEIDLNRCGIDKSEVAMTMIFAAHGAKYAQGSGVDGFRERLDTIVRLVIGGLQPAC